MIGIKPWSLKQRANCAGSRSIVLQTFLIVEVSLHCSTVLRNNGKMLETIVKRPETIVRRSDAIVLHLKL